MQAGANALCPASPLAPHEGAPDGSHKQIRFDSEAVHQPGCQAQNGTYGAFTGDGFPTCFWYREQTLFPASPTRPPCEGCRRFSQAFRFDSGKAPQGIQSDVLTSVSSSDGRATAYQAVSRRFKPCLMQQPSTSPRMPRFVVKRGADRLKNLTGEGEPVVPPPPS